MLKATIVVKTDLIVKFIIAVGYKLMKSLTSMTTRKGLSRISYSSMHETKTF